MNGVSRYREFSLTKVASARVLDVHSFDAMRELMQRQKPVRYRPLVRYLSAAMRHRVMILADGDAWARTHAAIGEALHPRVVESEYAPVICAVTEEALERVADAARQSGGVEIEVEPLMRMIATSALGYVLFGEALSLDEAAFVERTLSASTEVKASAFSTKLNLVTGFLCGAMRMPERQPIVFHRSQRRAIREIFVWLDTRVEAVAGTSKQSPLLARLMERYAELPRRQRLRCVASEIVMLFVAGIETTAAALTTSIAEMAANPKIRAEAETEARRSAPVKGESLTARYPYLHAVFREALRRHTIVPTMLREAETAFETTGTTRSGSKCPVHVLKGTAIRYLPVVGHMRRKIWGDPQRFDPQRFMKPLTAEQTKHYIPFGFGAQRCPGHALARTEAILILAEFLRRFDVETKPLAGIAMERNAVFTNRPLGVSVRVRLAGE